MKLIEWIVVMLLAMGIAMSSFIGYQIAKSEAKCKQERVKDDYAD